MYISSSMVWCHSGTHIRSCGEGASSGTVGVGGSIMWDGKLGVKPLRGTYEVMYKFEDLIVMVKGFRAVSVQE